MRLMLSLCAACLLLVMGCKKDNFETFKIDKVTRYTYDNGSISVTLNKGSQLRVSKEFDNYVSFTGEAYITVDSTKSSFPDALVINAAGYEMHCRHGTFNVNVFASSGKQYESNISTFNDNFLGVITGSVVFRDDTCRKWVFPIHKYYGVGYPMYSVNAADLAGWTKGVYHFDEISIGDFLTLFRAWYGFNSFLELSFGTLKDFTWNPEWSLEKFIETAEQRCPVDITYDKDTRDVLVE